MICGFVSDMVIYWRTLFDVGRFFFSDIVRIMHK